METKEASGLTGTTAIDKQKLEAFAMRALSDFAGAYVGLMVSLGSKLGLYKAMADGAAHGSDEIASRTGCAERYVREWLNAQAASGYISYHADADTYSMPPEHALVLADEGSPAYFTPAWEIPAALWAGEARALEAFRTGKGIPWGAHDGRLHCGVASFYRNGYRGALVQHWLPSLDGVVKQLEEGITVADVGCGHGHSTILMAQAFPNSRFHGYDSHAASIEEAKLHAAEAGVADRVTFEVARAVDYPDRQYGLVCFFDCLHDLGDPVAAARYAREVLAPGGTVFLVEPFANDRIEDNISLAGQLFYTGSTLMCCAHAISEGGHLVLGAQAGEARLGEVFRQAGFSQFRRTAETPFNLILEARR